MKRLVPLALCALFGAGAVASAQQTLQQPLETPTQTSASLPQTSPDPVFKVSDVQTYIWLSSLGYHRIDDAESMDTNRLDLMIPRDYGSGVVMRGVGQLFAPTYFYRMFRGSVYNDTSYLRSQAGDQTNDQDYIAQFQNASSFTIDSVDIPYYKNPQLSAASFPVVFGMFRVKIDPTSSQYAGVPGLLLDTLPLVYENDITPEGVDSTAQDGRIHRTRIKLDSAGAANVFSRGETVALMLLNLDAPAVQTATATDDAEYMLGYAEIKSPAPSDTLPLTKALGLSLFSVNDTSRVYTLGRALTFTTGTHQWQAPWDADMYVWGSIDVATGVRYQFGTDATAQGLGEIAPNPVSADTRIPFSLTEKADVTVQLFGTDGALVRELAHGTWVPGVYSADLSVDGLRNGVYLVRMIAGTKIYSRKLVVAR